MNTHTEVSIDAYLPVREAVLVVGEGAAHDQVSCFAGMFSWEVCTVLQRAYRVKLGHGMRFAGRYELAAFLKSKLSTGLKGLSFGWIRDLLQPNILPLEQLVFENDGRVTAGDIIGLIERRELESWFQPIFDSHSEKIWGYECLMRAHVGDKLISPAELVTAAESEQLLSHLDRIAREVHLENASRFLPSDCKILINTLPSTLLDENYDHSKTSLLVNQFELRPSQIVFEVMEREPVDEPKKLRSVVDEYRKRGFGIALDDMGSAYAGLTLLAELDPEIIKIDRELIANAKESSVCRDICRALVDIGQRSGKPIVAEGIETEWQRRFVTNIGATLLQGFLCGPPVPSPSNKAHQPSLVGRRPFEYPYIVGQAVDPV